MAEERPRRVLGFFRDRILNPQVAEKRQSLLFDRMLLGGTERVSKLVQDRVEMFFERLNRITERGKPKG